VTALLLISSPAQAYWVWSPQDGKFVNPEKSQVAQEQGAEERYAYAMTFYSEKEYDKAEEAFQRLVKNYPKTSVSGEAQFRLGEIYEEKQDYYKAFQHYQRVAEEFPGSARINDIIQRQFRIGNLFLSGQKAKVMGVPLLASLPKAIEIYEKVIQNAPFGPYGDKAMFQLGLAYKKSGNFYKAKETFGQLIDNYADSDLVKDAKFEVGEVSYSLAAGQQKSLQGLGQAKQHFSDFVEAYPEAAVRDKADRMKSAVDVLMAEKNYKVGEYYEKQGYLDSAAIYYEDVSANYSHTPWGKKAADRLAFFDRPDAFMAEKEKAYEAESARIELRVNEISERLETLPKDSAERKQIEERLELLEKKQKKIKSGFRDFEKGKSSDIKARWKALDIREEELREKRKNLEKRREGLNQDPSAELQRVFQSWEESLRAEEQALAQEKIQMDKLASELGVSRGVKIPFVSKSDEVSKLREVYVDDLNELTRSHEDWQLRKEELYDFLVEVSSRLDGLDVKDMTLLTKKSEFKQILEEHGGDLLDRQQKLEIQEKELEVLSEKLVTKQSQLDQLVGQEGWGSLIAIPSKMVRYSWDFLTFGGDNPSEDLNLAKRRYEELGALVASKREIVNSLQQNLASTSGEAAPLKVVVGEEMNNAMPETLKLKKRMRLVEREIRWRYDEILDRNLVRRKKIDALDRLLKQADVAGAPGLVSGATRPVRGSYNLFKAFIFGLPNAEQRIGEQARAATRAESSANEPSELRVLKEEIELETFLIQARAHEIDSLQTKLATLTEEAKAYPDFKYRPVFYETPGTSIDSIVQSAEKMLPNKGLERQALAEDRIDTEIVELGKLQDELAQLGAKMEELRVEVAAQAEAETTVTSDEADAVEADVTPSSEKKVQAEALKAEVDTLKRHFQDNREDLEKEQKTLNKDLKGFYKANISAKIRERFDLSEKELENSKEYFFKERKKTQKEILEVIEKQEKIVEKEEKLLTKRTEDLQEALAKLRKKGDYQYESLKPELSEAQRQLADTISKRQALSEERSNLWLQLKGERPILEK